MIGPIRKMADYYIKDMKLKHKLLLSHLLLVLIPTFVVAIIFYNQFYDLVVKSTVSSEQALVLQGGDTLETILAQVEYVSNAVTSSSLTDDMFGQPKSEAGVGTEDDLKNYYQSILSMIDKEMITDIRIYYDEESFDSLKYANTSGTPVFKSISNITSSYWYGIFSSSNITSLYCPSLYLSHSELRDNGEMAYICRIPYTDSYSESAAFVAVYFADEKITDNLINNITLSQGANYIVNERAVLIASSDNALAGAYFMTPAELESEIGSENSFVTNTIVGENLYIGYQKMKSADWYLVSVIPVDDVVQKGQSLVFHFILIYLIFVIAAFVIAFLLSGSIEKRLNTIVTQMKKVRYGKPQLIGESQITKDEIGDVADTYNYMTDEINHLLLEQERAAKEMRLSEFKALQAQINPHFLYNSLDMINWLTQCGRKEEASKAVQALSRFYKLTLSKKDAVGPLEMELEHVSLYVQLQNMRYNDAVELLIDIPPDMMEYTLPRLTFQPIVENAIQHGIAVKPEKKGTIVITGWREEDDLQFLISDDGVGMDEEQIALILSGQGSSEKGSNIGVYNTHRRLQLLFGAEYGLHYESSEGSGTEVTVRIKMKKEE